MLNWQQIALIQRLVLAALIVRSYSKFPLVQAHSCHCRIPSFKLFAVGSRTFPIAVVKIWIALSENAVLRHPSTGFGIDWRP